MCNLWCLILIVNLVLVIGDDTPKKADESKDVKFKSSFPYNSYGHNLYESPSLSNYYGNGLPYGQYPQYGSPVSYPSFFPSEQYQASYPVNSFNSYQPYQPYQSLPVNYYPQYIPDTYASQFPTQWQSFGYPAASNPISSSSIGTVENIDLMKLLSGYNYFPTVSKNKTSVTVPRTQDQKIYTTYIPTTNFGGNGGSIGTYGNMPFNPYNTNTQYGDPYANIPTEIIDVDYTGGFRSSSAKLTKPIVKVTSHSEQSGISTIPVVKTESSVVTMKPLHTVITRMYDSSRGDTPIVKVENVDDEESQQLTTNEILPQVSDKVDGNHSIDEEENEEPSDVNSWFK